MAGNSQENLSEQRARESGKSQCCLGIRQIEVEIDRYRHSINITFRESVQTSR
jgi:hypothetical protein